MLKREKKPNGKKHRGNTVSDAILPQNILEIGEHAQENKRIYIYQPVYKEIHHFTKGKTVNESGGILLGNVLEEFGRTFIIVRAFIEAKHTEATPTTLKFTHETWEAVHKEAEKKYPQYTMLGWIHTHPDYGIFLSEYDRFIQENFFREENQIAYVIDPVQESEGFFTWQDGKIERSKGFGIFDNTGVKIKVDGLDTDSKRATSMQDSQKFRQLQLFTGVLCALVAALVIACIIFSGKISEMSKQIDKLQEKQLELSQYLGAITASMQMVETQRKETETNPESVETSQNQIGNEYNDTSENGNTSDRTDYTLESYEEKLGEKGRDSETDKNKEGD